MSWKTVATFARRTAKMPRLPALLGAERVIARPGAGRAREIDAVIGWGEKATTRAAITYAHRHDLPYWRAEDGFLRSIGLGVRGAPALSLVLDDRGIYYDARKESLLERLIRSESPEAGAPELARARAAMDRVVAARLSKYNDAPTAAPDLGPGRKVLVVDQTRGDLSIECGLAGADSFRAMLAAALAENPDAEIVVKTHPDVLARKKRGYLQDAAGPRVRLFTSAASPHDLFPQVERVYVVTSQVGFEAVMAGKPVTCFGAPFYAGWGLTDDRVTVPRRGVPRTAEQVFAAAYLRYARYVDPDTGEPCELERVLDHLELQRRLYAANTGRIFCLGFRPWKHGYVRRYLRSPGNRITFVGSAAEAESRGFDAGARLVVWGQREDEAVRELASRHGVTITRMEDGFLRSVGLGSDLATPASLVVDAAGIYYDPRQPSDLETLLQAGGFTGDELARARRLRQDIVRAGVSKYNVGADQRVQVPSGKRIVLVPGQVEDDASVRLGSPEVRTNLDLLREVRRAMPGAFIVYKPHPDVVSGNRTGRLAREAALQLCDRLIEDATLGQCLAVADEVHTLTSLVGFEALLRELRVVVYGQPFYSGWGLTHDRHPVARRTRRLGLDELVAGTMLRYPRYLNRAAGTFTTPEVILAELAAERDRGPASATLKISWPRRQLRKLVHAYRGVVHAP